jgi:hypothetical protein
MVTAECPGDGGAHLGHLQQEPRRGRLGSAGAKRRQSRCSAGKTAPMSSNEEGVDL